MNKRLLIVEDNRLLSDALAGAFKDALYTVYTARSSQEAFKVLKNIHNIDLIFLDILLLGDETGIDILKVLKNHKSPHLKIPVVMMSNSGKTEDIEKALELGAIDYIVKANIDLSQLVAFTDRKLAPTT